MSQWGCTDEKHTEPEQFNLNRNNKELERFKEDFLDKLKTYVKDEKNPFSVLKAYVEIKNNLMNKGIENTKSYINTLHINVDKQKLNQTMKAAAGSVVSLVANLVGLPGG